MKLKKGDKVKIMTGKDGGKEGSVEKILAEAKKIVVTGLNLYKRSLKPKAAGQKGSIVTFSRPISVANVALICPKCKKVTRVGYKLTLKKKTRICKKCQEEI